MEQFSHPSIIWFALGLVLFLLEFAAPGLVLFFFGVGAWVAAIAALIFNIPINSQLIIFIATSILSVLFFRNWLKKLLWKGKSTSDYIDDEFIGKIATVEIPITPTQNGKIAFKGTHWEARADERIEAGEKVMITGNNSIILNVKPYPTA